MIPQAEEQTPARPERVPQPIVPASHGRLKRDFKYLKSYSESRVEILLKLY